MTSLIVASFFAGVLTILAPCVLPVLPVILAGSISEKKWWYSYVVTLSLALSIVLFTVLLKASTLFLGVPTTFWTYISGGLLIFLGAIYIFPHVWTMLSTKLGFTRSNVTLDNASEIKSPLFRAIATGAALGPVFSTCSPTYIFLLATIFPVSFVAGIGYTMVYALGLALMLSIIAYFGRLIIAKLRVFADERGKFRKILGVVLVTIGIFIILGLDKKVEAWTLERFDIGQIETKIFPFITGTPKTMTITETNTGNLKKAYFAGGCFWCMEGIFEAQDGVVSAVSGYAEGTKEEATYELVSAGMTTHREAVEITYDPAKISFTTLVDLFYTQIDPTQVDGQFADKGFRYTTAAYYQDESEQMIIENARATLEKSGKFDKPIAVKTVPFTTFFPAEEYHQDYYKKSAFRYNLYKEGSGRKDFIDEYGKEGQTIAETENAPMVETKSTQYLPYDETKLATLTGSRIFLFFHASWCPTCVNFEKQILAAPLPSDVVIFKVDYDTATELKKKYSVLSQSTWVQIDSKGDMYKRWLGKSQLQDIFDDSIESKDLLLKKLTPLQYEVTQMGGTETPFDNEYWDHKEAGIYVDIVDGTPLFSSTDKFDSGTGWPSFTRPISESKVATETDTRYGMARTEIKSSTAGSHLGHVFNDGPSGSGGLRYCINSSALRFVPVADLEKEGYGEWKTLFKE